MERIITEAATAWHGFCLASEYTLLNSFLRRAVKLGYYDKQSATITDLFDDADDAFFSYDILQQTTRYSHVPA